jgi:hypothetical protein
MGSRKERLRNLVRVQHQLKAFHEMRHAVFVAEAQSAGAEAAEIMARTGEPASLLDIFPDVYARSIGKALARQTISAENARSEATRVAVQTARTNIVERAYHEARLLEDRKISDKERLEAIQRSKSTRHTT